MAYHGKYKKHVGKVMWSTKTLKDYAPTVEEYNAMAWCLTNGIQIYIHCDEPYMMHLAIRINGKENISPKTYDWDKVLKKKYEFYKYYYDKYYVQKRK
tara:strand:- start:317 stop:610 length:294 start_codon:yes stop_codon:yes gene_type:complete